LPAPFVMGVLRRHIKHVLALLDWHSRHTTLMTCVVSRHVQRAVHFFRCLPCYVTVPLYISPLLCYSAAVYMFPAMLQCRCISSRLNVTPCCEPPGTYACSTQAAVFKSCSTLASVFKSCSTQTAVFKSCSTQTAVFKFCSTQTAVFTSC
jgi:hypothetical protein